MGLPLVDHWVWLILGCVLVSAELLAPGYFLMWIGAAALLTGVVSTVLPIGVTVQLAVFSISAIAAVYAGRHFFSSSPVSADPKLNDKGARLVGEIVTVVEAIDSGRGRVKLGDGVWTAKGNDAPAGTKVRITGVDGQVLLVEAA